MAKCKELYNIACDIPEDEDGYITDSRLMDINNVLNGNASLDLSHTGGEFQQIMEEESIKSGMYTFPYIIQVAYLVFLIHQTSPL